MTNDFRYRQLGTQRFMAFWRGRYYYSSSVNFLNRRDSSGKWEVVMTQEYTMLPEENTPELWWPLFLAPEEYKKYEDKDIYQNF